MVANVCPRFNHHSLIASLVRFIPNISPHSRKEREKKKVTAELIFPPDWWILRFSMMMMMMTGGRGDA